jgi:predicted nucleic acid-binding protein
VAVLLGEIRTLAKPSRGFPVFRDAPENRMLECAVEGRAEVVVARERAVLAVGEYEGNRMTTFAIIWISQEPGEPACVKSSNSSLP